MIDIYSITDTVTLINAVEQIKQPVSYLVDTFFPTKDFYNTSFVAVEYRKEGRQLAPAVVNGSKGININRGNSKTAYFTAPLFAPRRVIGLKDLELRQFGEVPSIYSAVKPEERLAGMQAADLTELMRMHANRKEQLASSILQTGKVELKGYADDGVTPEVINIDYELNPEVYPPISWSDGTAKIYDDLLTCSMEIQESSGEIPTLMICGKGVERQLLNNDEIKKWLMIPNRENLSIASFAPRFTGPNARFIGYISALNLEIVSYLESYTDESGQIKPYIDDNTAIIGNVGKGRQLYGAVSLFGESGVETFSAEYIPQYTYSQDAQQYSLTVYGRYVLAPNTFGDWKTIRTLGE